MKKKIILVGFLCMISVEGYAFLKPLARKVRAQVHNQRALGGIRQYAPPPVTSCQAKVLSHKLTPLQKVNVVIDGLGGAAITAISSPHFIPDPRFAAAAIILHTIIRARSRYVIETALNSQQLMLNSQSPHYVTNLLADKNMQIEQLKDRVNTLEHFCKLKSKN